MRGRCDIRQGPTGYGKTYRQGFKDDGRSSWCGYKKFEILFVPPKEAEKIDMKVINVMNFVRSLEPRDADVEKKLLDTTAAQLDLVNEQEVENTLKSTMTQKILATSQQDVLQFPYILELTKMVNSQLFQL